MIHRCGRCDFGVAREDGSCDGGCDSEEDFSCPGCDAEPGDGYTADCHHPVGCGYYKAAMGALSNRLGLLKVSENCADEEAVRFA